MFILGVGAQKAGTTWLWQQLTRNPGYRSLGRKELHYWDRQIGLHSRNLRGGHNVRAFMTDESVQTLASLSHGRYFTSIERALRFQRRERETPRIVADITPAYAGLPRGIFRTIMQELELRGVDYRVIYFMREPVSRIVSAFNMRMQEKGTLPGRLLSKMQRMGSGPGHFVQGDGHFADQILEYGSSWECQFRTRYEITVANLMEVFPPQRLFFGFTESLSDSHQIEGLSKFLGLPVSLFNPGQRVGDRLSRGRPYLLPPLDVRDELRLLYRSTYKEIQEKFPEVRPLWGKGGANKPVTP